MPRRVAAALAERFGECVAELPVVGFEVADAFGGELEPGSQRRFGGALTVWDALLRALLWLAAEPLDFGA